VNLKDRLVYAREVQKTTTPAAATQPKTITWRYPFLFGLRFLGRESTLQCQPHARIAYPLQSWVETSDAPSQLMRSTLLRVEAEFPAHKFFP